MKKLIYIANARIPTEKAHGIQIMKMCEALAQCDANNANKANKIEVELLTPRRFNSINQDPFEYYDAERVFEIKRLPCLDLVYFGLEKFGFLIQTVTFLISAKIYLFFKRYDILYTREQLVGLFFKDFILEIHSLPSNIKTFHKKIWQKAKTLIVLTSFIKKRLVEAGVKEDKILVAPDGVDLEKFQIQNYQAKVPKSQDDFGIASLKLKIREELGLPQDKILIGYVGMLKTMDMEKGIDVAIQSLKFLDENYILVLVGGKREDIEFYKKQAEESNLSSRVFFIGWVKHKLVPLYLKSFDILITPFPENKHYKFYMSPLKIFEYMASGAPIIASDLPSIREILNENNAVLVEPDNAEKLAEGIKKVLLNKDLADKISKQALEDVQGYTWQKRAEKILEFISR
jgi:glycosyltransferase involved in cell wall biosynthesis